MLVVANWKAYVENRDDAKELFALAKRLVAASRKIKLVLAPPAPFLGLLAAGNRTKVLFAGQDVSLAKVGAATGEVSAGALRAAGASYVIVGHSERRAMGETDEIVAEKMKQALIRGLTPILCVGERERDEEARYLSGVRRQVETAFSGLSPRERLKVVVAYEPVWAIGRHADDAITSRDLTEMTLYIRKVLGEFLAGRSAQKAVVLYGGSAEAPNVAELAATGIDGFLVGHASADPKMFAALVKALR